MKEDILNYMDGFGEETTKKFHELYELIYESYSRSIEEKLWAKLPSFYVESRFIRLIPFKDHINIEAKAMIFHMDELEGYKITPKGMLQIYHNQQVPKDVLKTIFKESLE